MADLIHGFESGTWPAAEFTHSAHIAVAAWYILSREDALDQLRTRIPAYNVSQGNQNTRESGYHETLTCFWFHILSDFLEGLPTGTGKIEAIQAAVAEFGSTPKPVPCLLRFRRRQIADSSGGVDSAFRSTKISPKMASPSAIHCSSVKGPPSGFEESCMRRYSTPNRAAPYSAR